MKGIILAGGMGTRLYPITKAVSKQLLPVYDKPIIYYPLSTLMLSGIRDILIISAPQTLPAFESLLDDGSRLGINISYAPQPKPGGIAESFIIGEKFIAQNSVCLILGDNIFYCPALSDLLQQAARQNNGATIFGYCVKNPERYGVIGFDKNFKVSSITEKPNRPKSNHVVTGLYFYDNAVVKIAKTLKPSPRGELEITDINKEYLKKQVLKVKLLDKGSTWLDMGTYDALMEASIFIKTIEKRRDLKIGCIEETAYRMGYIDIAKLEKLASSIPTGYGDYLRRILKDEK